MDIEYRLLQKIETGSADEDRLIYIDWLVERGDVRAEFIALELQIEATPFGAKLTNRIDRLTELSHEIDNSDWEAKIISGRASEIFLGCWRAVRPKKSRRQR